MNDRVIADQHINLGEHGKKMNKENRLINFLMEHRELFEQEYSVLIDLIKHIPFDGYRELMTSLSLFSPSQERLLSLRNEILAIGSLVTLANILDDIFESEPDIIGSNDSVEFLTLSVDLGNSNIISIQDLLIIINSFIESFRGGVNFLKRIGIILKNQITFTKKVDGRSIEEAMEYRSKTLGEYFNIISLLANDEECLSVFSNIQFNDDLDDIEEDRGNQIQPFLSLAQKYNLQIEKAKIFFQLLIWDLDALKVLLSKSQEDVQNNPHYQRYLDMNTTEYFVIIPDDSSRLQLIRDFVKVHDFYNISNLQAKGDKKTSRNVS